MNTKALIDALVRQTTVLIAHVATAAGLRAPLSQLAGQVFLDLTSELERQGVGQKVIADMFGLALRSYQQKLQRLSESATDQGRSLWEAVYDFLGSQSAVRRAEVLRRFVQDDEASVKAILRDLCDSGLVYRAGRGDATVYRRAPPEDFVRDGDLGCDGLAAWLWVHIHHEGPLSVEALATRVKAAPELIQAALDQLLEHQRIVESGSPGCYSSQQCVIPLGAQAGWEAALLDQFQAMVRSMCIKLANGQTRALPDDEIGGSTYTFDVWRGHPQEPAVRALLRETRLRLSALWNDVDDFNRGKALPPNARRITFYFGQSAAVDVGTDVSS